MRKNTPLKTTSASLVKARKKPKVADLQFLQEYEKLKAKNGTVDTVEKEPADSERRFPTNDLSLQVVLLLLGTA